MALSAPTQGGDAVTVLPQPTVAPHLFPPLEWGSPGDSLPAHLLSTRTLHKPAHSQGREKPLTCPFRTHTCADFTLSLPSGDLSGLTDKLLGASWSLHSASCQARIPTAVLHMEGCWELISLAWAFLSPPCTYKGQVDKRLAGKVVSNR